MPEEKPTTEEPQTGSTYRYKDRAAARLMKEAKHDPETTSAVHAARRYGPVEIATESWGRPGTGVGEMRSTAEIPRGQASTLRGRTVRWKDPARVTDVNVRPGADAPTTLAHELGHVIMQKQGTEPRDPDQREAAADLFGRQVGLKQQLPKEARDDVRVIVVRGLGEDIRRGGEADLSQRPSAVERLNTQLRQEREEPVRNVANQLQRAGLDAFVAADEQDANRKIKRQAEPRGNTRSTGRR